MFLLADWMIRMMKNSQLFWKNLFHSNIYLDLSVRGAICKAIFRCIILIQSVCMSLCLTQSCSHHMLIHYLILTFLTYIYYPESHYELKLSKILKLFHACPCVFCFGNLGRGTWITWICSQVLPMCIIHIFSAHTVHTGCNYKSHSVVS